MHWDCQSGELHTSKWASLGVVPCTTRAENSGTDLAGQGGDDALCVHEAGVAEVVQAAGLEDLGAGLEPDSLTEGGAVLHARQMRLSQ